MAIDYSILAQPKGETRKRLKARAKRLKHKETRTVRQYCFGRERDICRCCRFRPAESLHEMRFRSQGGKVSRRNSIAVCGDGVRGCHGLLQRHEIVPEYDVLGAEDVIIFTIASRAAADWCRVAQDHALVSPPMIQMEQE